MKLFYLPGACSMASHIVLNEFGEPVTLVKVNPQNKTTEEGENYLSINPNGYVPALQLDDGNVLTENIAILTFLAEGDNAGDLALPNDRLARAQIIALLSFLTSELHKAYSPFFAQPKLEGPARIAALEKLDSRIGHIGNLLGDGRPYLTGDNFSVADAYAFVILNWSGAIGVSLANRPLVEDYIRRVGQRPAVQKALAAEGRTTAAA
jgi:glutathione S-transferase